MNLKSMVFLMTALSFSSNVFATGNPMNELLSRIPDLCKSALEDRVKEISQLVDSSKFNEEFADILSELSTPGVNEDEKINEYIISKKELDEPLLRNEVIALRVYFTKDAAKKIELIRDLCRAEAAAIEFSGDEDSGDDTDDRMPKRQNTML